MANQFFHKGVSNRDFGRGGGKTSQDKLLEPNAKDHPDTLTPNNELKQHEGGKVAGKYGTLGVRGKQF